ncbi:MAG: hypothetical protein P8182_00235 [Deltaproteobacteria bacterium]
MRSPAQGHHHEEQGTSCREYGPDIGSPGAICGLFALLICGVMMWGGWVTPVGAATGSQSGYKKYEDPLGRFSFEYPATMKVTATSPDHVKVTHPKATLRINIFIQKRPRKRDPRVRPVLEALKRALKQDMKDASVIEEGKLRGPGDRQGYLICSFRDQRGIKYVQLVHYAVSEDRLLQMIISDRPRGFKNLEKVIRKIHHSLKIHNPKLK